MIDEVNAQELIVLLKLRVKSQEDQDFPSGQLIVRIDLLEKNSEHLLELAGEGSCIDVEINDQGQD